MVAQTAAMEHPARLFRVDRILACCDSSRLSLVYPLTPPRTEGTLRMKEVVERLAKLNAGRYWDSRQEHAKDAYRDEAKRQIGVVLDALAGTVIGDADCAAIRKAVLASQSYGVDAINRIAAQIIDLWRGILASDGETPKQKPTPDNGNRNSRVVPLCADDQLKLAQILGVIMNKHGYLPVAAWHAYSASNTPIYRHGLKSMAQDIIDEIVKVEGKVFTEDAIGQTESTPAPLSEVGRYMKSAAEEILNGNAMPPQHEAQPFMSATETPRYIMKRLNVGQGPASDDTPAPPLGNGTFVNTTIANAPAEKQWSVLDDPGAVPPVPFNAAHHKPTAWNEAGEPCTWEVPPVPLQAAPPAPTAEAKPPNQGCANCQWSEYTQIEPGQIGRSPHPLYCTWTKNFWPSPLPWEPRIFMRPDDGFMCSTWKRKGTDV